MDITFLLAAILKILLLLFFYLMLSALYDFMGNLLFPWISCSFPITFTTACTEQSFKIINLILFTNLKILELLSVCLGKTIVIFAPAMFSTYFHYQHLQYWIEVVCIIIYISKCTTYSVSIVYNRVLDTC